MTAALELRDLNVGYRARGTEQLVLRGVSFQIAPGETFGLVGESGCGKSTAAFAALRALPRNGFVRSGQVLVDGDDVMRLDPAGLRRLRMRKVSMVYQDPGRALNPSLTIGRQLAEVFQTIGIGTREARERSEAMLAKVRISAPARVMAAYPHQLSGGMQQRVVIAMALAKDPALLVLDEPTTGLDATVEAEVLDLIDALKHELHTSILFISHNIAIIERMCDRVGVLYAGSLVEEGSGAALLARPLHPYTQRLLRCLPAAGRRKADGKLDTIPGFLPPPGATLPGCVFAPRCDFADALCRDTVPAPQRRGGHTVRCHHVETAEAARLAHRPPVPLPVLQDATADGQPALRASALCKTFAAGAHSVRAVTDVSLELRPGETLGLVGESGSGKTTLARLLLGLTPPDPGGRIELAGRVVADGARARSRADQKALQIVFQNPDSALNRAHTVRHLIERSLSRLAGLFGRKRAERLAHLVSAVRLTERHLPMRPRQLSGGLKQRVAIARAFAGDPRVVICDEPTSALDVSVQAAILNLLADLQAREGVSYVFISHDLGVVRYLSDRIAVLYLGRILEIGPAEDVFEGPHHPYTEALLSAVPEIDADRSRPRIRLSGEIPSPLSPPSGCVFHGRCPRRIGPICDTEEPPVSTESGHAIRCHLPVEALGRRGGAPPVQPAELPLQPVPA